MNYSNKELSEKLYQITNWREYQGGKVWMRSYHLSEMGQGNDLYESTAENERRQVVVGEEWRVTDDPLHRMSTGQEVFKWWYSKVRELEEEAFPAYDLGFLIRKLPVGFIILIPSSDEWLASWAEHSDADDYAIIGETPEDALTELILLLIEKKIFNPGISNERKPNKK